MRVDAYTKVVLTIIAACLVWMCLSGAVVTPVTAQRPQEPQEVVLIGSRTPVAVISAPRTSLVVRPGAEWYQDALPVDAPRPLATRLTGIEHQAGAGRWDPLDVNVKEQARKATPGH
jgi:hypothetical protein